MEIELVPAKVLHALAKFASPKDIRTWLRGVWAENSSAGLILWATDGRAVAGLRVGDMAPCESFQHLLPLTSIAMAPRGRTGASLILGAHEPMLSVDGARIPCPAANASPPDFRRVFPSECSHQPAQIDTALWARFATLAEALGRKKDAASRLHVSCNGLGTARVHIPGHPEFVGCVRPLREHATALPEDQPFNPPWLFSDAEPSLT